MLTRLGNVIERARYLPALAGSGLTFLGAATALGAATPEHWLAAASSGLLAGVGAAFLNEFHKSFHELKDEEKARRNHLIRRGMAQALRDALMDAQADLAADVPSDLRKGFFRYWPDLLRRAQTDDDLLDLIFPLRQTEDEWDLLNRYEDDLRTAERVAEPSDRQARLRKQELHDQEALAALLSEFPLHSSDDQVVRLFSHSLLDRWSKDGCLAFAAKLLPAYRISFATVFSEDGPTSRAIEYKGSKFTRKQLEDIQFQLQTGIDSLGKQIAGVGDQVSEVDAGVKGLTSKVDNLERMMTALLEKQIGSGEIPRGVVTPQNKTAKIEAAVRELPTVIAEIKESPSPVATANVEELLAAGRLDEAATVGQTQFDCAQKAYAEQDRNFAQACYDMGLINELSFRWTAALENYRQAWELSDRQNAEYGFRYAVFAASLNLRSQAIAVYEAILPLWPDPAGFATTLNNLGALYAGTQRHEGAEGAYIEALNLYRELASTDPATYEPYVGMTLNNLGNLYAETQRHDDAGRSYAEALTLYRKLVAADPIAYEPYVAISLNNFGALYARTQRHKDAKKAYTEGLTLYRKLAAANPVAYEPYVAATLNNLGALYAGMQRHEGARMAYLEALRLRRKMAVANPAAYEADVATTLNNLGALYAETQRHDDAEAAYSETLKLYRKLADANPDAYGPDVAMTLNNLGSLYMQTQRHDDAGGTYAEALALCRKLADVNPAAYEPNLATTLNYLGSLYMQTQRHDDAEGAYTEALTLRRKLAVTNPAAYEPDLATTLNNLGILYNETQCHENAERAYTEALALRRKLAAANPAAYEPDLAMTLNNLGYLYVMTDRDDAAEGVYTEAPTLYRKLAGANSDAFEPDLATTLNNLGFLYLSTERTELGEEISSEAEQVAAPLWLASPIIHADRMAKIFFLRAHVRESASDYPNALDYAHRALSTAPNPAFKAAIQEFIEGLSSPLSEEES